MGPHVITKITTLTQILPDDLTENDREELTLQQDKLNALYKKKAEGAFVRSRCTWLEEGEQNTAYFFQLERSRNKSNSIKELNINGTTTDDPRQTADYCSSFYSNLYKSQYNATITKTFLEHLTNTKSIINEHKDLCDNPITLDEVKLAILHLKLINLQVSTA